MADDPWSGSNQRDAGPALIEVLLGAVPIFLSLARTPRLRTFLAVWPVVWLGVTSMRFVLKTITPSALTLT